MMKTFINYFFMQHLYPTLWSLVLLFAPTLASDTSNHAFREALEEGNIEFIQALLMSHDLDVNKQNEFGSTLLMLAIDQNYITFSEELLKRHDMDVNKQNGFGSTALMLAIDQNHIQLIEQLLKRDDIDVNKQSKSGYTALMSAICRNHVPLAELLLKHHDIDINLQNNFGYTALMGAIRENHVILAELLLKRDEIKLNLQNKDGYTALMLAIDQHHIAVAEQLLQRDDIDLNLQNCEKKTALACIRNRHIELSKPEDADHCYVSLVKRTHLPSLPKDHVLLQSNYLHTWYVQKFFTQAMQQYTDILLINKLTHELAPAQRLIFYQTCLIGYEAKNSCYSIAAKGIEHPKKSSHYQPVLDKDLTHLLAGYLRGVNMKGVSDRSDWVYFITCYLWANNRFAIEHSTVSMPLQAIHFWHKHHSPYSEFLDAANSTQSRALFQVVHQQGLYEAVATEYFANGLKQKNIIQKEEEILEKSVTWVTPIIVAGFKTLNHQPAA